ncbi:MAG: hypothetical protein HYV09_31365 [Deltaproteobacteria bacterium]|nr:hypothetical protein [Deltaproteobacteria bacterium]
MRKLVKLVSLVCSFVAFAGCAVQSEAGDVGPTDLATSSEALGGSCRWKVKLSKYYVSSCGSEAKCETWVRAAIGSDSVTHPAVGLYTTVPVGSYETVGETISTVTSSSSSYTHSITFQAGEYDVLRDTVTQITWFDLPCSGSNRTETFTVQHSGYFNYVLTLAYEKQ